MKCHVDKLNVFGVIGYLVPAVGPEILHVGNSNASLSTP